MQFEFIKELYRDAWASRDRLAGDLSTPIGLVTVLGGILAYYVNAYQFEWNVVTVFFSALLALGTLGVVITSVFIFLAFHGYTYWTIPTAAELVQQHDVLRVHYAPYENGAEEADRAFEAYLTRRLIEAIDLNTQNNESRAAHLYRARRCLAATAIMIALCTMPWVINRFSHATVSEVKIIGPVQVTIHGGDPMSDQPSSQNPSVQPQSQNPASSQAPPSEPSKKSQAPTPPDGPPLRPLQEGQQPSKRK